jgi:hypothetical protein
VNESLESFKEWVLLSQKKELQPIVEEAKQITGEIMEKRWELDFIRKSCIGKDCVAQQNISIRTPIQSSSSLISIGDIDVDDEEMRPKELGGSTADDKGEPSQDDECMDDDKEKH